MSEITLSGNRPESSLQIWEQLLDSLRRSGFRDAGPEYCKLSKLVAEVRRRQVVSGCDEREEPVWQKLSELGGEAYALLAPLTDAARILAELPLKVTITPQPPLPAGSSPAVAQQPFCAVAGEVVATPQALPSGRPAAPKPARARKPSPKAKASRKHTRTRATNHRER